MKHIEFISYDGAYPNLCRGTLILRIDGTEVVFNPKVNGFTSDEHRKAYDKPNVYHSFWESGGYLDSDYEAHSGPWIISEDDLPEKYRKYIDEIDEVFNYNVSHGCCGGCS